MAQTKSDPIGALAYLSANPDTETAPNTTSTSDTILANMQKRMDEISSPRNQFENQLQKAHAWTLYDKTPAFRNIAEQEQQQSTDLQNIGSTLAQIKMMRDQNALVNKSLNAPAGTSAGAGFNLASLPPELRMAIQLAPTPDAKLAILKEYGLVKGKAQTEAEYSPTSATTEHKYYTSTGELSSVPHSVFLKNPGRYPETVEDAEARYGNRPTMALQPTTPQPTAPQPTAPQPMATPDQTLKAIAKTESGDQPIPNAMGSSAFGEYQMTKPTFEGLKKNYPSLMGDVTWEQHNQNNQFGKAIRDKSAQILQSEVRGVLKQNDIPDTPINQKAAWLKGSLPWLKAVDDPTKQNNLVSDYLTPEEVKLNKLEGKTVGQWKNENEKKLNQYISLNPTKPTIQGGELNVQGPRNLSQVEPTILKEMTPAPFGKPRNRAQDIQDLELTKEGKKLELEKQKAVSQKASEEDIKSANAERESVESIYTSSKNNLRFAEDMLEVADSNPDIFAKAKRGPATAFLSEMAKQGAIPGLHKIDDPNEIIAAATLTPEKRIAYDQYKKLADRFGLQFANENLPKGSRQSVVELQTSIKSKGVDVTSPYEVNKHFANEILAHTHKNIAIGEGWQAFQSLEKSKGVETPSYADYKRTKYYTETVPKMEEQLYNKLNQPGFIFMRPGTVKNGYKFIGEYGDNAKDKSNWEKVK